MKVLHTPTIILKFIFLALLCSTFSLRAQILTLDNPSFDFSPPLTGNANVQTVASPWLPAGVYFNCGGVCNVAPSPDTWPDSNNGASNGTEYVGLFSNRINGQFTSGEALYQNLKCPLLAGVTYTITMDVRLSAGGFLGPTAPGYVGLFGANVGPVNDQFADPEILDTVLVSQNSWVTETFSFTPTQDFDILVIGGGWSESTGFVGSYLHIDNITNTVTSCGVELDLALTSDTICNGECSDISASIQDGIPPFTITWDNGLPNGEGPYTVCPTQTTTYTAIVEDSIGQTDTTQITLTVVDYPNVTVTASEDTICENSQVTLTASGSPNLEWSTGDTGSTISDTPPSTTTYSVIGAEWQCYDTATITINVFPPPFYDIVFSNPDCFDSSNGWVAVTNVSSNNYSATWNGVPGDSLLNLSAGTYNLELIDNISSCIVIDNAVLTTPSAISNTFSGDSIICLGDSSQIISNVNGGTPGYTYLWSDGSQNSSTYFSELNSGTLNLEITDANNCSIIDSLEILIELPPQLDIPSDYSGCEVLTVNFLNNTSNATNYQWEFGDGSTGVGETPTHNYQTSGIYDVTVSAQSSFGCTSSEVYTDMVIVYGLPKISLGAVSTVLFDLKEDVLNLTGGSLQSDSCVIDFGDGTVIETCDWSGITHEYTTPGNYIVTVNSYNDQGCSETAQLVVVYKAVTTLYIPNTFTPDGDEFNNDFGVKGQNIEEFEMNIYNRWGQLIFTTFDINVGWDGTYNEKIVKDGTYVYSVRYKSSSDEYKVLTGHINLIR